MREGSRSIMIMCCHIFYDRKEQRGKWWKAGEGGKPVDVDALLMHLSMMLMMSCGR